MTPGYKTTEFWLSTLAILLGAVMSSGIFTDETSLAARIVGGVLAALATLGYTAARAKVKAADSTSPTE